MPKPANSRSRKKDILLAAVFFGLTVIVVACLALNPDLLAWAFRRHHNVLSWYIRPIFLILFCLAAYRRSLAGIGLTLLLLVTSMFWFPAPNQVSPQVQYFLQIEMDYLTGEWTLRKAAEALLVPATLTLLAGALWRRNILLGLAVLVLIAVLKMVWSINEAGQAGIVIFAPAILGLALCIIFVVLALRPKRKR